MSTTAYHPDLRRIARVLPRAPFNRHTLPVMRALTKLAALRTPKDVEVLTLSSGTGVRLHRPPSAEPTGAALLWIHGGGYVMGRPPRTTRCAVGLPGASA